MSNVNEAVFKENLFIFCCLNPSSSRSFFLLFAALTTNVYPTVLLLVSIVLPFIAFFPVTVEMKGNFFLIVLL